MYFTNIVCKYDRIFGRSIKIGLVLSLEGYIRNSYLILTGVVDDIEVNGR